MRADSVKGQKVEIVGTGDKTDKMMPIKPIDNSVAVPLNEGKTKNADFSSNKVHSIPLSSLCWYVAKVKANHERMAKIAMKALEEPIEIWVPGLREVDKDNGNIKRTERYHIYGFVFFRFLPYLQKEGVTRFSNEFQSQKDTDKDSVREDIFRNILSISYVRDILKIPGERRYAPIPAYQIERFRRMVEYAHHPVVIVSEMVSKGQKVRFVNDEYKDIVGVVESISDNEAYLYVVLDYLGCAKMKVRKEMVEPIDDRDDLKGRKKPKSLNANGNRTICEDDWLALHPYNEMMPVDQQYLLFAKSILSYLDNGTIDIPYEKRKSLALSLACYIEDKRSHLRLFSTLVATLRQKKKYFHPVELLTNKPITNGKKEALMADYSTTKINALDLSYLLLLHSDRNTKDIDFFVSQGIRLCLALHNMGCGKLKGNSLYADERRSLLLNGWRGLKRFLLWIANGPHYLSHQEGEASIATILSDGYTQWDSINPLYFTLTFARKTKVGDDIVNNVEGLKVMPLTQYDVLGDDVVDKTKTGKRSNTQHNRHTFLLKRTGSSHTSKRYPVVYDEISTRKYVVGATYTCQLANYGENWFLLTPPVKSTL